MANSLVIQQFCEFEYFCEFEEMSVSSQVRRDSEINPKMICLQIVSEKGDNISKDRQFEPVIIEVTT